MNGCATAPEPSWKSKGRPARTVPPESSPDKDASYLIITSSTGQHEGSVQNEEKLSEQKSPSK
jgi:hypothetical protein